MEINEHYYQRLNSSFDDLCECTDFCNELEVIEDSESILCKALTISLIVTYARNFASAYSYPRLDNDESKLFKSKYNELTKSWLETLPDEMKCFHESVIERRNSSVAHSDAASRDYRLIGKQSVLMGSNPHRVFEKHEIVLIRNLIEGFMKVVASEHTLVRETISQPYT
ncbi:hypothetical protein J4H70_16280 [Vibrio alginolyticus]|uniref:hypothetical protein n=1 Tax=Vibrio alginolyticus TaxID=663 RepID=UPI001BD25082|nr:hypothetical protein [Vibrio alginolyticus]MBS9810333.1 hypothetical protein [Vibrio alginolyticus]